MSRRFTLVSIGRLFLRWRGYLPLTLPPVVVMAIAWTHHRFESHATDLAGEDGSLLVMLAGFGVRVAVAEHASRCR